MIKRYVTPKVILFGISILYISFIIIDLKGGDSRYLKYISILLCFTLSLLIGSKGNDKIDTRLLQGAFFFTTLADLNLVILDNFFIGVAVFCFVQILYIIRHSRNFILNKKTFTIFLVEEIMILALIAGMFLPSYRDKAVLLIGGVYAILLLTSVVMGTGTVKRDFYSKKNSYFIAIGMILFLLCDINVGLYHLGKNQPISGFLVWIFYLPSQIFLSLSGFKM